MPWSESIPQFSSLATILGAALLVYAAVGEPLLGRWAFNWLGSRRDSQSGALAGFYWGTIGLHLVWVALIAVLLVFSPELSVGHVGVRLPSAWGPLAAAALGFALALVTMWLLTRTLSGRGKKAGRGSLFTSGTEPAGSTLEVLAPRSRYERWLAAGVAVTAGVGEELLYRGLFLAFGVSLGVPLWAAAIVSCLLYAGAHIYQGWWGLVGPGLLGALFTVLYLGTGSLLVPVVLHIGLELRSLLLTGTGRRHRAASV
ncbi:CAAX prenyl protease-like protein [Haloactinospora alba]|uniref:CAAX prenyl protease-like protein n=1 Tax=Haloactinospora alba TaxID=405555 RepID=A0A543NLM8_9ACTN|nr:CPBP family intramembrane glutamic endopeptidase [Haloactinospora alba]TQN32722.1 CAAX prenyl protease-like protein [Haloactinospora alba]